MIDRVAAEISVVLFVAVVALVSIPVPRPKPPVPVETPAPVPAPVELPVVPSAPVSQPAKSEEGEMPLQVERVESHVTIQQLLVKLNRIERKLNEVQEDERAGQPNTN